MKLNLTLSKQALILVTVPLVFELAFVATLGYLLQEVETERAREMHALEISTHLNALLRLLLDRGTSSVLRHLSKSQAFDNKLHESAGKIVREFKTLEDLIKDDPHELARWARIHVETLKFNNSLNNANTMLEAGDNVSSTTEWIKMQGYLRDVFQGIEHFVDEEEEVQKEKKLAQVRAREKVKELLAGAVVFNILLAFFLALYFNKGTSRRFKILMDNTLRLAADKPLNPPIKGEDEIAHLDLVFRNMAQGLAEARRKERAVVDNAVDVICSVDEQGKFTAVNPAAHTSWGYTPDELLGKRLASIVFDEDISHTNNAIQRIIAEQEQSSFDNRILCKDGSMVDMQWSAQWSTEEKSLFCVAHDITERKKVDQMKRDFIAMVSHDLRTPLTSIQMVHSLLAADAYGVLSDAGHDSVTIAEENVSRLITLVNDLLDIEKMESGQLELHPETIAVDSIIEPSVQAVLGFAEQNKVGIETLPHSDIMVFADKDRLVQVVINLLSNAVKFSPEESTVKVGVEDIDGYVQMNIIDNGRGVPDKLKSTIFERFKQVEKSDERKKGGSGLGLAICKAIVERHQGSIGVISEEGKGSTFWFRIPKNSA